MTAKPMVLTLDILNESEGGLVVIIQPSKREPEKISVWLKDYKLGDFALEDVVNVVADQISNALKKAGYELKKKLPKIGDPISFKKAIGGVAAGEKGIIVGIEPERPYSYVVKVKDMEIFARLDDFELL